MITVTSTQTDDSPASGTPASNSPEKFGLLDSIDSSDNSISSHELFQDMLRMVVRSNIIE